MGRYIDFVRLLHCQVYIFAHWPGSPYGQDPNDPRWNAALFDTIWERPYVYPDGSHDNRDYYNKLCDSVVKANPDVKTVRIVPVGEVFYQLNKKMAAGQVPGYTRIWQVYIDGIHMNQFGNFIASTTYYATVFKTDPRGLPVPYQCNLVTPEFAKIVQQTVWDVVTST